MVRRPGLAALVLLLSLGAGPAAAQTGTAPAAQKPAAATTAVPAPAAKPPTAPAQKPVAAPASKPATPPAAAPAAKPATAPAAAPASKPAPKKSATAAKPAAAAAASAVAQSVVPCLPPPASSDPRQFRDCADSPELIKLNGGTFSMGEQGGEGKLTDLPVHDVTVRPFAIGKFEVTFLDWFDCVNDHACNVRPDDDGWGRGFRPVIHVNWFDALEYVAWLSKRTGKRYRLPTESEWEFAARAGTETVWSWGDASSAACDFSNSFDATSVTKHPNWFWNIYCDDGYAYTAPVGSYKPNPWGLYDVHGNVWEWTSDCWHADYTGAPVDGSAWIEGGDCRKRVNRGGGWSNHPRTMRSANRDADNAFVRGDAIGFRVVRELEPSEVPPPMAPPPADTSPTGMAPLKKK